MIESVKSDLYEREDLLLRQLLQLAIDFGPEGESTVIRIFSRYMQVQNPDNVVKIRSN